MRAVIAALTVGIVAIVQSWLAGADTIPRLDVVAPPGLPGDIVELAATLTTPSVDVAGVKADMVAPSGGVEFLTVPDGGPDCTVDPALDKSIAFQFLPPLCQPGVSCTGVQVAILGDPDHLDPIPDETMVFQCAIRIADDASGVVPLTCNAGGQSTADSQPGNSIALMMDCAAAGVVVEPTGSPTLTAAESPTDTPSPTPTPSAPPTDTARPTDTPPPGSTATATASGTPTRPGPGTPTATGTATTNASPTATMSPAACLGDCAGTGHVTIDDLIRGVDIVLGTASISNCPAFDPNDTGRVTIATLIEAVNNALTGCPASGA